MASSPELQKVVIELYVVQRPLSSKRNDQVSGHKVPHQGCVAVTKDGDKYLIEKGVAPDDFNELHRIGGEKGSRIVKISSMLPPGFEIVQTVTVLCEATLHQLLEASGCGYNFLCSNCWNSTESMKKVVTDDLHLPWQFGAGLSVGVIAVFAMVLFAVGRLVLGAATRQ